MSHEQQQQEMNHYYGTISPQQMNVSPPKNVIDYGNSSLSITPVQNEPKNLSKEGSKTPSPEQLAHHLVDNFVSKVNLVTVEPGLEDENPVKRNHRKDGTENVEKHLNCQYCGKSFRYVYILDNLI